MGKRIIPVVCTIGQRSSFLARNLELARANNPRFKNYRFEEFHLTDLSPTSSLNRLSGGSQSPTLRRARRCMKNAHAIVVVDDIIGRFLEGHHGHLYEGTPVVNADFNPGERPFILEKAKGLLGQISPHLK